MPDIVHLDYETFSFVNLKKVGAYRYAADPSTRILMACVALNDGEPHLILPPDTAEALGWEQDQEALDIWYRTHDPDTLVYAHSATFEIAISRYRMYQDLGLEKPKLWQWRCTAAMARRAALPASLDAVTKALKLVNLKDPIGKKLIQMFSVPKKGKRLMPEDDPTNFWAFVGYCKKDVKAEQSVHSRLKPFEMTGEAARTFALDCTLNDRGVPVNVKALRHARTIVQEVTETTGVAFTKITGLGVNQGEKFLNWLRWYGYPYENLQATTVARALEDTSWVRVVGGQKPFYQNVVQALKLKQEMSFSAVKKIDSMLACQCGDALVRGTHLYYGAGPGRWAGRLIQPQNFKRPTMKNTQDAYADLCAGFDAESLRALYGPPMDVVASCIRHFIQLPNGQKMNDADYSAIEARGVCWLAGQEDALERFRNNEDSYIAMASHIFNRDEADVTKDQRWLGKQTVLGCGYQMGAEKFLVQAVTNSEKYNIRGIKVDMPLAEAAVAAFREQYDKVRQLWWDCDRAARNAILHPGKLFRAGKLRFAKVTISSIPYLVMKLPSGRNIVYPYPELTPSRDKKDRTDITYWGKLPLKKEAYGRIKTYGGKLTENACQGFAADIMAHGAATALEREFDLIALIHDQALSAHDGRDVEEFCAALTDLPAWAADFPVKAEGKVVPYYLKL